MTCDNCKNTATVHLTEIKNGKKIEKHLCEACAHASDDLTANKAHMPINELLTNFVMQHSGAAGKQQQEGLVCEHCGMTWAAFRQNGMLGCEHDYTTFERELAPLLQRAHEGGAHHVGKVPTRRGGSGVPMKRSADVGKLRKELARAIETEDYERAAKLRDSIRQAEGE